MALDLLIVYGSVRRDRQGIKAARFMLRTCLARGHQATLIDPAEDRLPLLDRMYKEYQPGQAPEVLEQLAGKIKAADAFIIVTGEYNHSIPPALSNLLDHFLEEYFWRPSAIVCYSAGAFGGVRAAMQLRAMLCDDDGRPRDDAWNRRADRFLRELEWYAGALKEARKSGVPY
jgi:NAD(P)H-dependent FMN reductase